MKRKLSIICALFLMAILITSCNKRNQQIDSLITQTTDFIKDLRQVEDTTNIKSLKGKWSALRENFESLNKETLSDDQQEELNELNKRLVTEIEKIRKKFDLPSITFSLDTNIKVVDKDSKKKDIDYDKMNKELAKFFDKLEKVDKVSDLSEKEQYKLVQEWERMEKKYEDFDEDDLNEEQRFIYDRLCARGEKLRKKLEELTTGSSSDDDISSNYGSGSEEWDQMLDAFETSVNDLISATDNLSKEEISALPDYGKSIADLQELADKCEKAEGQMSASQVERYTSILQKYTTIYWKMFE